MWQLGRNEERGGKEDELFQQVPASSVVCDNSSVAQGELHTEPPHACVCVEGDDSLAVQHIPALAVEAKCKSLAKSAWHLLVRTIQCSHSFDQFFLEWQTYRFFFSERHGAVQNRIFNEQELKWIISPLPPAIYGVALSVWKRLWWHIYKRLWWCYERTIQVKHISDPPHVPVSCLQLESDPIPGVVRPLLHVWNGCCGRTYTCAVWHPDYKLGEDPGEGWENTQAPAGFWENMSCWWEKHTKPWSLRGMLELGGLGC